MGPLEENAVTRGAGFAPNTVFALKTLAVAFLLTIKMAESKLGELNAFLYLEKKQHRRT